MLTELCLIYAGEKKKKRPQRKRMLLAFTESGFSHFSVNENLPNSRL